MDNIPEAMKEREQMVYEAFERLSAWADISWKSFDQQAQFGNDIETLRAELGFKKGQ